MKFIDEYAWYPPGVEEALNSLQNQRRVDMGSLTRAPKMNKPTKGMKTQLKQGLKALKKAVALAAGPTNRTGDGVNWYQPKWARELWLNSFRTSNHKPHQGAKEMARRVRQKQEHKCINPEVWT